MRIKEFLVKEKKFFGVTAVLLALGLLLTLTGCGETGEAPEESGSVVIKAVFGSPADGSLAADNQLAVWTPGVEALKELIEGFTVDYKSGTISGQEMFGVGDDLKFDLPPGNYEFSVEGWTGYDATAKKVGGLKVAISSKTAARTGGGVNVFLGPVAGTETGTLIWGITGLPQKTELLTDKITYENLDNPLNGRKGTLKNSPGQTLPSGTPTLYAGTESLPRGSYLLTFPTKDGKGAYQAVVHIYPGLTTVVEIVEDDFKDPVIREAADIQVNINGNILNVNDGVYSPLPNTFQTGYWYINGEKIVKDRVVGGKTLSLKEQGVEGTGGDLTLDWYTAAANLKLDKGVLHTVTYLGNAKGFWLAQTLYLERPEDPPVTEELVLADRIPAPVTGASR
jgi:hypothetical protein